MKKDMRSLMDIINEAVDIEEAIEIDHDSSPPEKEDDDDEHYDALKKTGFFGAQGAGAIVMAKTTGRILIMLRSGGVEQPHTWGNCGGAFKINEERPVDAAAREVYEETGYSGKPQMIPLLVFKKDTFTYYNFLALVEDEFKPHLGWEADSSEWCDYGNWPTPLHFGLKALFGDPASAKAIQHYAGMFAKGIHESVINEDKEYWENRYKKYKAASDNKDHASAKKYGAELFSDHGKAMMKKHGINQEVDEDLILPPGVNTNKAIDAAQDMVNGADPTGMGTDNEELGIKNTNTGQMPSNTGQMTPNAGGKPMPNGQQQPNGQPVPNGQQQPNGQPGQTTNGNQPPMVKKNLGAGANGTITPQGSQ